MLELQPVKTQNRKEDIFTVKRKRRKIRKCILPHTTFHTPLRAVLVRKSDGTECTGKREGGKKKFKGTFSA